MRQQVEIELDEALFVQMDELACELSLSHDEMVALALQTLIKQRENARIRAALDAVYAEPQTAEEAAVLRDILLYQQQLLADDPWE